jgi:adenine-specific DNA-methyltransferase
MAMSDTDLKQQIAHTLARFASGKLGDNARDLFNVLGYRSDKTVRLASSSPQAFLAEFNGQSKFNAQNALFTEWTSAELIFQLTSAEVAHAGQRALFESNRRVDNAIIESYVFIAIGLKGDAYTRTQLAAITRQVNKLFPMPALILFQHGNTLTLAVIDRRLHKKDESKDVLEKVTLIKDIRLAQPHRAHIEILFDLALDQLRTRFEITNWVQLHNAWRKTLDTSELNKRFFREIANWYFWAQSKVKFPKGAGKNEAERNAISVIRLLTRLIFVWFVKEKNLVPDELFDKRHADELLKYDDPKDSTYYKAILQNLFFGTLNTEMGTRAFRHQPKAGQRADDYLAHNRYRYQKYFKDPDAFLKLCAPIPFLNGGLFECLDKSEEARVDGFSDRPDNELVVPDELFFGAERSVDLSEVYGDARRKRERVRGLIHIFDSYKFTVDENTPIEEEIALDPELLGKVFENLLAAYNPETGVTARKQTGSFYTPREIVNYMVDESLKAYFESALSLRDPQGQSNPQGSAEIASSQSALLAMTERLRALLAYNDEPHGFSEDEVARLIAAIDQLKALDPACGSGAFPMGLLHKLVYVLRKLDPDNARWKALQVARANALADPEERASELADIEDAFANDADYARKLYLIENCLYGVDIQPIAVQIAKLRCFISLIVDDQVDDAKPNRGIRPLPNLETKFVAANSLIGIERPAQMVLRNPAIDAKEKELAEARKKHFTARTHKSKEKYRALDAKLRTEIGELLRADGFARETTEKLAAWNPYDQNTAAEFFDPEWMFDVRGGFDIVIGNPPYVRPHKLSTEFKEQLWKHFSSFVKKSDLYCCFIEKGIELLKNRGAFAFIVSDGFLRLDSFENLRHLLLENTSVHKIIDFEGDVFESATVKTCILLFSKGTTSGHQVDVAVASPETDLDAVKFKKVPQDHFKTTYKSIFDLSASTRVNALKAKILDGSMPLGEIFDVSFGLKTGDDERFLSFSKRTRDHKPLLRGEDVSRYSYTFKGEYVWYVPEQMTAHRNTARPGTKERFEQPKVLIRDTGSGLMGTFDDENFYVKDVLIVSEKKKRPEVLKLLLGILNSSLMRFYYESSFPTLHVQRNELASLPIKLESSVPDLTRSVAGKVDRILAAKRKDPNADTSALEREIDQLVYQLYGLTEEEIAVVEGKNSGTGNSGK